MKILIFGATGMLGHRLMIQLSKYHEVYGTIRDEQSYKSSYFDQSHIIPMIHCGNWSIGAHILHMHRPDVVINCTAAIPQRNPDIHDSLNVNADFPHFLAKHCRLINARLVHFSTDAVFSGKRGNYTEDDEPDGSDTYALTKRLGEISDQEHVLTLRCCPIGRELNGAHSLVEWFLAQTGEVKGYTKAHFNPLTTHEIADLVNEYVLPRPDLHGVYHIGGSIWQKAVILHRLKDLYKRDVEIIADGSVERNRILSTRKFDNETGYKPRPLSDMLEMMRAENYIYEGVHANG